ncbi:plasmid pRiA4b ORF-3 family protein [Novosphingobium pentaromativorans]|nr:plasmid pRiA4b ORF-3 family protein [Novosphingobium pentaromativorans]
MSETIARLHIALADTDPSIWRRVDVPVDANLKMLHDVIQGAMGWLDYHLWEFEAGDRRYGVTDPDWPDDRLFAAKNTRLKALLDRDVRQLDTSKNRLILA